MKTATVQDLELDLPSVLHWLEEGEQVSVLKQGQTFALMVPVRVQPTVNTPAKQFVVPDFLGQMREMFGDHVLTEEESAEIREVMRGGL